MDVEFSLTNYLNNGVENIVKGAIKASFQNPKETAFMIKFMLANKKLLKKEKPLKRKGNIFHLS